MTVRFRKPLLIPLVLHFVSLTSSSTVASFTPIPMPPSSASSPTSAMITNEAMPEKPSDNPRSCILQVGVSAGRLCGVANSHLLDNYETSLVMAMADLFVDLYRTSQSLNLNLVVAIRNKLELNCRKYPVDLCKVRRRHLCCILEKSLSLMCCVYRDQGKAGKYTQYSTITGVTLDNQSTTSADQEHSTIPFSELVVQLPYLVDEIKLFAEERDWTRFHTPRNIILALLGEVGELAELIQWKGDEQPLHLEPNELDKLSQELADVSIYLLRLASITNVTASLINNLQFSGN